MGWLLAPGLLSINAALLSLGLADYPATPSIFLHSIEVVGGMPFGIFAGALIFLVRR